MPLDKHGLTIRQRKFCDLYVKTMNGAESARVAGYSKRTAREMASENLAKPHIKRYIDMKMEEAVEKIGVGRDWRLEMLKKGIELNFQGKADKDGCIDLKGLKGLINEMNKMTGDHAPVTSNLNVSETNLEETVEIAQDAEKEIDEIKAF
ncbi:MAG TPA: terminase small subunit [Rummeliibacillus sp.]|nr:terminase small subunit [Rummeliibacillus sp.]